MRLALLGPPGAGKGSLAAMCQQRLGLGHLSTGDIFRQEIAQGTAIGRRVHRFVADGKLVPDGVVVQVMAKRLRAMPRTRGFVLDGFPRTVGQARGLDAVLRRLGRPLDGAIYLTSPQAVSIRRLSGRRVCQRCGANYHIRSMRPRRPGECDRCRGRLVIRDDDRPSTIKRRLAIDRVEAAPLVRYYEATRRLYHVDGTGLLAQVFARILIRCRRQGWLR